MPGTTSTAATEPDRDDDPTTDVPGREGGPARDPATVTARPERTTGARALSTLSAAACSPGPPTMIPTDGR